MPSHHYPDPHAPKPNPPAAKADAPPQPDGSAEARGTDGALLDESAVQARVEKRNEIFGDPMQQQRHQQLFEVKKTALSPGEKAAMGKSGPLKTLLLTVLILALAGGGLWLIYGPLQPPPAPPLPAAGIEPPVVTPRPVVPPTGPTPPEAGYSAHPPAFAPLALVFAGADGAKNFTEAASPVAGWAIQDGLLEEPARPGGEITWLKGKYRGDLDVELQVTVMATPDQPDEAAREFRIVFGDRTTNTPRVVYHVPSREGANWAEVLDEAGAQTAIYGHNRYGWPFVGNVFYRVKISRRADKWMISRDGEFMFPFFCPAGVAPQIGYVPVSGARIQSIQVTPR